MESIEGVKDIGNKGQRDLRLLNAWEDRDKDLWKHQNYTMINSDNIFIR